MSATADADIPARGCRSNRNVEYVSGFEDDVRAAIRESACPSCLLFLPSLMTELESHLGLGGRQMTYTVLGQDIMEGILRERLQEYGVGVEMGTELRSLKQDTEERYVDVELVRTRGLEKVEERADVEWLIGADGAHGVVRKHLDVTFLGETRDEAGLLVGDFRISGLDGDVSRLGQCRASGIEKDLIFYLAALAHVGRDGV